MDWIQSLNSAIAFIETHICEDVTAADAARHIYLSSFHFQRAFRLMTWLTVSEYVRNRRLSLAAGEIMREGAKVIDVALKYGYECVQLGQPNIDVHTQQTAQWA